MTDRFNALIVVLDKDVREDDAQSLMQAISQFKGVASVSGNVADISDHIAKTLARRELLTAILELVK